MKKELNKMKNEITYNQLENILSNTLNKLADEDKRYLDKINTEKRRLEKKPKKKLTQLQKVINWYNENNNVSTHYKIIANELDILVPNVRRVLGQGTLKDIFTRTNKGTYRLNK